MKVQLRKFREISNRNVSYKIFMFELTISLEQF